MTTMVIGIGKEKGAVKINRSDLDSFAHMHQTISYESLQRATVEKERKPLRNIDCNNLRNMKGVFSEERGKSGLIRFIPLFPTSKSQCRAPLTFMV